MLAMDALGLPTYFKTKSQRDYELRGTTNPRRIGITDFFLFNVYFLRTTDNGQRSTVFSLRTTGYGLRSTDFLFNVERLMS